eukprot:m.262275 g.262275  ORF g.262275 m.262275 type:complete len:81 (+) comp16002_c0_seq1:13-255(+)
MGNSTSAPEEITCRVDVQPKLRCCDWNRQLMQCSLASSRNIPPPHAFSVHTPPSKIKTRTMTQINGKEAYQTRYRQRPRR